jgi:outer membrane biosynthesis protein TonB
MKEKMKRFLRKHWKPLIGMFTIVVLAAGILIVSNLKSNQNLVETSADTERDGITIEEEVKTTEVPLVEEMPQVEDTKEQTKESTESSKENTSVTETPTVEAKNSETEKPSVTKKPETKSEDETTTVVKPTEKPVSQEEPTATVAPTTETKYVPISEGWKSEASAKGDINSAQKADLDSMIQNWKSGALTDADLKDKIISYLEEQKIDYMEVSVTSKGYALFDEVPEIDLRDGGNLYSYVGTYSTGKQNPDGTNKTVCYNWSAFVF